MEEKSIQKDKEPNELRLTEGVEDNEGTFGYVWMRKMIKERWSLGVVNHSKSTLHQNEYLCPEEKGGVHRRCLVNFVLSSS